MKKNFKQNYSEETAVSEIISRPESRPTKTRSERLQCLVTLDTKNKLQRLKDQNNIKSMNDLVNQILEDYLKNIEE